jgi:hypothetical protein
MNIIRQLFTPEEAFVRLGQNREAGCLVIVSSEMTVRVFVDGGCVIAAYSEKAEGESALDLALSHPEASHMWMPDAHPLKKTMTINIAAHVLKNSIARDIHLARTGKVQLPAEEINVETPPGKGARKEATVYYLVPADRPNDKLVINKPTVIVGRDNACDIVLDSIQVSRRHCLMQIVPRGLSFRDLDSTNGVTINGFPAKDGFLNHGDKLRFGTYALEVRQGKK